MRSLLLGTLLTLVFAAPQCASAFPADFDGDGKTDPTVWRPSTGVWYVYPSSGACPSQMTSTGYGGCYIQWGLPGDKPITGDFDIDGKADFSVWRPSNQNWYIRYSSFNGSVNFQFPTGNSSSNDIPDEADLNGDSRSDIIHFRRAASGAVHTFFYRVFAGGVITETQLNAAIDSVANIDATYGFRAASTNYINYIGGAVGDDEMAVMYKWISGGVRYARYCFRTYGPSPTGACDTMPSPASSSLSQLVSGDFGGNTSAGAKFGDLVDWYPVNGIWNVYRPSGTGASSTSWGNSGDIPLGADYTGDEENDYAVFRPNYNASGYSRWFFQLASCQSYMTPTGFGGCYLNWGLPGDEPVV